MHAKKAHILVHWKAVYHKRWSGCYEAIINLYLECFSVRNFLKICIKWCIKKCFSRHTFSHQIGDYKILSQCHNDSYVLLLVPDTVPIYIQWTSANTINIYWMCHFIEGKLFLCLHLTLGRWSDSRKKISWKISFNIFQ